MSNDELKEIIKESVHEAIKEERLSLYEILIPQVSKKEMEDIIKKVKSPDNYKKDEFVDRTSWIKQ